MRLFPIRLILTFCCSILLYATTNAQLVDGVLGQKRSNVSVLMRPYRIVDYKLERVVHDVGNGIHQTVFFENDTCNKFYWAVPTTQIPSFLKELRKAGYATTDNGPAKDSLTLIVETLPTGSATLYIAVLNDEMRKIQSSFSTHKRQRQKQVTNAPREMTQEPMPLLQQAILAEDADSTAKPMKDPQRHWIGEREGNLKLLGW